MGFSGLIVTGGGNDRAALLRSWVPREAREHWGRNTNYTYRMTDGDADEHGSLGFSQVLYGNRFGNTPCAAHDSANLNPYHPGDSIQSLVVHSASNNASGPGQSPCEGSFYQGFHASTRTLDANFANDIGNIEIGPGPAVPGNVNDLRGYRHANGAVTPLPPNEDDYDVLAKAILGYNGGTTYSAQFSWAKFLKYKLYRADSHINNDGVCHSCRYSIQIRNDIFGANMRTFIWEGGQGVDVNGDGSIADILDDPNTIPDEEVIETTVPWCFAYGEENWVGGITLVDVRNDARGDPLAIPPILPVGQINCLTGQPL